MTNNRINFLLPPSRIVQGHPANKQTTDYQGNVKANPSWYFAVASEKNHPQTQQALNRIVGFAFNEYSGHAHIQQRIQMGLAGGFSFKIEDGDDPKHQGKEGYAGCWIFKFSTTIGAPGCFDQNMNQIPPDSIKTGYWVEVSGSCSTNGLTDNNAGVYLNPDGVMLTWFGQEIRTGPSPQQMFAGRQAPQQMPAGASSTPVSQGGFSPQPQGNGAPPAGGFNQPAQQPSTAAYPSNQHPQQNYAPPAGSMGGGSPQSFAGPAAGPSAPSNQYPPNQQAGFTGGAPAQGAPGFAGQAPAPSAAQPGYPGTASPSSQYPGATPHTGWVQGGGQQ